MSIFSRLFFSCPETLEDLDKVCRASFSSGEYQKAARTAQTFRDFALKATCFDEGEKFKRAAVAYCWICRSAFEQASRCKNNVYQILVSFFASHKMAAYYFGKVIKKDAFHIDETHALYPRYDELNQLYSAVYDKYEPSLAEKADLDANQQISF